MGPFNHCTIKYFIWFFLSVNVGDHRMLLQSDWFYFPDWFGFLTVSMLGLSFGRVSSQPSPAWLGEKLTPPFTYSCLHLPLKVSKNTFPSLSFSYDNSQLCIKSSVWPFKEEWHGIQWRRLSGNIYQRMTTGSLMHVLVPVLSLTPTLLLSNPGSKWVTNVTLCSFIAANSGLWLVVPKQSRTFVDSRVPPDCLNYCNPRLRRSSRWTAVRRLQISYFGCISDFSTATALNSCMLDWECKKDHPGLSCLVLSISPTFQPFIWVQLYLHSETTWENGSVRPLEWIKVAFNYLHHWPHEAG